MEKMKKAELTKEPYSTLENDFRNGRSHCFQNLSTAPYRKQAADRANFFSSATLSGCRGITLSRSGTARRILSTSIR